jgi:two-component system sensor histidine kinase YesM
MKAISVKEWVVLKLRPKIILANILLVFIPVIAMGTISYFIFSNAIETKSSNFYFVSLLETDRKLNFALNEITKI